MQHRNAHISRGLNRTTIELGRIINVDIAHWTVDIQTLYSHRVLFGVQVGTPYLHFHSGEGIYAMPEVGAVVQVALPSDGDPFVIAFVTVHEESGQEPTQHDTEGQETDITFSAGRPPLQQGDIVLRGRDGNTVWLHRGGVLEVGSTAVSKRVYLPIGNIIRDVCENYEMFHFGGELRWITETDENSPDSDAPTRFVLAARDNAQDENNTVQLSIGHVDDSVRVRLVVAPNNIEPITERVTSSVFDFYVDSDGNVTTTIGESETREVNGDMNVTVRGSVTLDYGATDLTIGGDFNIDVDGSHNLTATSSRERLSSSKVIDSPVIKLGGDGATTPLVLGNAQVAAFFASHTHVCAGITSGPPTPTVVAPFTRKCFGE